MVFNNFSDMEKVFLEYFFEKLDLFQIDYIVLRNYELLPETVEGSDIDILVRKKAFSKFINCFLSEVYNIGYTPWKAYRKNFGMLQYSFKPIAINNPQDIIRIDFIFDSVQWLGKDLLPARELWGNVKFHNNLKVLNHNTSILLSVINSIVYTGAIKKKYIEQFNELSIDEQQRLFNIFSNYSITSLNELCSEPLVSLRKSFLIKNGNPLVGILIAFASWFNTLASRLLHPPGEFIAIIGPDGSGKSTLADKVLKACKRLYPGISYFHLFPKLKLFRSLDNKSHKRWETKQQSGKTETELRQQSFGILSSGVRLVYLWLRFTLGYFLFVVPKKMMGQLVISDRWCYDIVFDPGSKGIRLPLWLRKLVLALTPKPARIFVLSGDPEAFAKRKKDLTSQEIREQIQAMKLFFERSSKSRFIRTDQSPQQSFEDLLPHLISKK
jgi:thymidylate kinase